MNVLILLKKWEVFSVVKVNLHFVLSVDVDEEYAEELGKDICNDIFCEFFNGEDYLDVFYEGYEVLEP